MRNLFFSLLAIVLVASCTSRKGDEYIIKGTLTGSNLPEKVFLQTSKDGRFEVLDTADVVEGKFRFEGKIGNPDMFYVALDENRFASFFNEAASINIELHSDSLMNPKVNGSESDKQYREYLRMVERQRSVEIGLYTAYNEAARQNDTVTLQKLEKDIEANDLAQKEEIITYIKDNNASFVTPYVALRHAYLFELEDMETIYAAFDKKITDAKYAVMFNERIVILQNVAIGKTAPDFTMNDVEGRPVSLSQFRGKYVLVDFWAAWCGPCRAENPNVVEAYNKFKDAGFDVLGVSLDRSKEDWMQAIAKDNLTWTHVSDLQYWQNAAAKLYGVNSIPANVLLDKDGVIIARNLRGEDLHKKLAEVLAGV